MNRNWFVDDSSLYHLFVVWTPNYISVSSAFIWITLVLHLIFFFFLCRWLSQPPVHSERSQKTTSLTSTSCPSPTIKTQVVGVCRQRWALCVLLLNEGQRITPHKALQHPLSHQHASHVPNDCLKFCAVLLESTSHIIAGFCVFMKNCLCGAQEQEEHTTLWWQPHLQDQAAWWRQPISI